MRWRDSDDEYDSDSSPVSSPSFNEEDWPDPELEARSPAGLKYADCSRDELLDFVNRRMTLQNMGWADDTTLIRILKPADDAATFRFSDLPPELRNRVYDHLLRPQPGSGYRCPQILAACRTIQQEATNILYGGNPWTVQIENGLDYWRSIAPSAISVSCSGVKLYVLPQSRDDGALAKGLLPRWPTWLLYLPGLTVCLPNKNALSVPSIRANIASFIVHIAQSRCLQRLTVTSVDRQLGDGPDGGSPSSEVEKALRCVSLHCVGSPGLDSAVGEGRSIGSRLLGGKLFNLFTAVHQELMALAGLLDQFGDRLSVESDRACEDVLRLSRTWAATVIEIWAARDPWHATENMLGEAVRILDPANLRLHGVKARRADHVFEGHRKCEEDQAAVCRLTKKRVALYRSFTWR